MARMVMSRKPSSMSFGEAVPEPACRGSSHWLAGQGRTKMGAGGEESGKCEGKSEKCCRGGGQGKKFIRGKTTEDGGT